MRTITKIELLLLVPITLVLTPLLTFGTAMLFVTVCLALWSGLPVREAAGFALLIMWLLAGLFGLVMVWIVTVEGDSTVSLSLHARLVRLAGLMAGAIAASLWLYDSVSLGAGWNAHNTLFWEPLFLPPTALGLRHGLRLFWNHAHPLSD